MPQKKKENTQPKKKPFMHIALNAERKSDGSLSHFSYKIKEKRLPTTQDPTKLNKNQMIKRSLNISAASLNRKAAQLSEAKRKGVGFFSMERGEEAGN